MHTHSAQGPQEQQNVKSYQRASQVTSKKGYRPTGITDKKKQALADLQQVPLEARVGVRDKPQEKHQLSSVCTFCCVFFNNSVKTTLLDDGRPPRALVLTKLVE